MSLHSIRRLNDPSTAFDPNPGGVNWTRVLGFDTSLAYGQTTFTTIDTGYSGDPLALVPWRPINSPSAFMYIGDRSRMRKLNVAGKLHTIGFPAPAASPPVALTAAPKYKDVETFDGASPDGFTAAGTAGGLNSESRATGLGPGTSTTISQILYDSGTTGWASVQLAFMSTVTHGERLNFATNPESAYVQDVFAGTSGVTATTIGAIVYDSGTTGACSIQLATAVPQIEVNTLLRNSTINENFRVQGKIMNPDGTYSIRTSTVGTFAATNNIQILPSLRIYLANTHAAGENVNNDGLFFTVDTGVGYLTKTAALDLSQIATNVPIQNNDFISIAIICNRPDLWTEMKLQLDIDIADGSTTGFTKNFYWYAVRPSDLTPALQNIQSLLATRATLIQRAIIDNAEANLSTPGQQVLRGIFIDPAVAAKLPAVFQQINALNEAVSGQASPGVSQWCEVRVPVSNLLSNRVGTDTSRSLQNVANIQIVITTTGSVQFGLDSWWIGGGFGPNNIDATASSYYYRYRAREISTNVPSNWSPATRYSIDAYRQSVTVSPPQYIPPSGTTLTTADFVLDFQRFGGQIADWHYVGTTANSATPSFIDTFPDDIVGGNPIEGMDNYQPWPIIGAPVVGTTGTSAGTSVSDSGTNFNVNWAPGTRIIINNQPYTIYRVISTSLLELNESVGSPAAATPWQVPEPTILAQPLPCLWEWDGTFFACGDDTNPGRLYYSNPNSETTGTRNYLDMTSPSEPLMNGLQYNVRSFVFSSENFIQILKTGDEAQPYRHENIPNGKGLFSRWGMTRNPQAPYIAILGKNGIYVTTGGAPTSITEDDLLPLFPFEGGLGSTINGISAPFIDTTASTLLRLEIYDGFLYFDYVDASLTNFFTLLWSDQLKGWFWDVYTPGIVTHYGEEGEGVHALLVGGTDDGLYQFGGPTDNGTPFNFEFTTASRDQNNPRVNKLYGDIMLDAYTAGYAASCIPQFNNNSIIAPTVPVTTGSRIQTPIPFGSAWQTARNISLNVVVVINSANRPLFYIWEPRWTFESAELSALAWEISPSSFGMDNFKHLGLHKISHVSTADLTIVWTIDGVVQAPITVPNSGGIYNEDIIRVPVYKAKLFKVRISSTAEFRLDPRDSYIEVKAWGSDGPYQQLRIFGDYSFIEG